MDYTVAVDGSGQAAQALMGAAGVSGIPHAFIVGALLLCWSMTPLLCRWACLASPMPSLSVRCCCCACWVEPLPCCRASYVAGCVGHSSCLHCRCALLLAALLVWLEWDAPRSNAAASSRSCLIPHLLTLLCLQMVDRAHPHPMPHAAALPRLRPPADASGTIRHHGHPMEPRFAQLLDQVCSQAAPAAAAGAAGGSGAAASPPKQERQLPPVTAGREELMAMPVSGLFYG